MGGYGSPQNDNPLFLDFLDSVLIWALFILISEGAHQPSHGCQGCVGWYGWMGYGGGLIGEPVNLRGPIQHKVFWFIWGGVPLQPFFLGVGGGGGGRVPLNPTFR